jgi:hypothetical protein
MLRFLQHEDIMYIFIAGTDYDAFRLFRKISVRLYYLCTRRWNHRIGKSVTKKKDRRAI